MKRGRKRNSNCGEKEDGNHLVIYHLKTKSMKNSFIILTLVIGFIFYPLIYPLCKTSLLNNTTVGCDSIPELNKQVIDFVKSKISKKVGRGECWDLASEALKSIDAHWDGRYKFGKEIFFSDRMYFPR